MKNINESSQEAGKFFQSLYTRFTLKYFKLFDTKGGMKE